MKDADWKDCINNNSSRKISPDISRAKSLMTTAIKRISLIKETNKDLEAGIFILFDKIKASLSKKIHREKNIDTKKLHQLKISA